MDFVMYDCAVLIVYSMMCMVGGIYLLFYCFCRFGSNCRESYQRPVFADGWASFEESSETFKW